MGSRAARIIFSAIAWLALGAAAYFILDGEQRLTTRRAAVRSFEVRAGETANALRELRSAQQAYVAAGQGVAFWMPRVATLVGEASAGIDQLRATAAAAPARQALMEAEAAVKEFTNIDRRVRDYLQSSDQLMAADVVFSEGGDTAMSAARQVDAAHLSEIEAHDAAETRERRLQAAIAAGAVMLAALILGVLAFANPRPADAEDKAPVKAEARSTVGPSMAQRAPVPVSTAPRYSVPALKSAAELCTEFGRATEPGDLTGLLGRAAAVMDAQGVIVWLAAQGGGDLHPVLAHGYPQQTLSRMPAIQRSANNAAATAYRTGALQIVLSKPGVSNGAVVAPLLSPDGCIGALTAEIEGGTETADTVQALAAIFAAQLAAILAGSAAPAAIESPRQSRTATA